MGAPVLNALALGGGLGSTTLGLMAAHGEITPQPDVSFYCGTADPRATVEHVDWLASGNMMPFPVQKLKRGDITSDVLRAANNRVRVDNPPFYTLKGGEKGQLKRGCTQAYKISLMRAAARKLYLERYGKLSPGCVVMWIGITADEAVRFTTDHPKYIIHRYPFLERATNPNGGTGLWMTARDCEKWLAKHEYPIPTKSACVFCPYRSNKNWRLIRDNPEEWQRAIEVDRAIRNGIGDTAADALFVHRDCVPLEEANIDEPDGLPDMFNGECGGVCGV